jgi:hypothetical protein
VRDGELYEALAMLGHQVAHDPMNLMDHKVIELREFSPGDIVPRDTQIIHILNVDRFTKKIRALVRVPFKLESLEEEE